MLLAPDAVRVAWTPPNMSYWVASLEHVRRGSPEACSRVQKETLSVSSCGSCRPPTR